MHCHGDERKRRAGRYQGIENVEENVEEEFPGRFLVNERDADGRRETLIRTGRAKSGPFA
jgi:hypothetical protein